MEEMGRPRKSKVWAQSRASPRVLVIVGVGLVAGSSVARAFGLSHGFFAAVFLLGWQCGILAFAVALANRVNRRA
jgi:hypothetical protein